MDWEDAGWIMREIRDRIREAFLQYQFGRGQGPTAQNSPGVIQQVEQGVAQHEQASSAHSKALRAAITNQANNNLDNAKNFQ